MHCPDDEALIQEIQRVLELDHRYARLVEAWNDDLVAQIRRCGRAAGRHDWFVWLWILGEKLHYDHKNPIPAAG